MYLFFDTETTGFYNFKKPAFDPEQPGLVQLGAVLDDKNRNTITKLNVIVNPEMPISTGAMKVHGITNEKAKTEGVSTKEALELFHEMVMQSTIVIAHNNSFDLKIMEANYFRAQISITTLLRKEQFCTMKNTTDILCIPGPRGYKWPKLDEAYRILVNEEGFAGAHDAMNDVMACRAVYYALCDLGKI